MKTRVIALLAIVALLAPSVSFGAITFDAATVGGYFATMNAATFNHTVTTTANPLLFVGTFGRDGAVDSVTGVTYGGQAMTKVASVGTRSADGRYSTIWYLINPPTGSNAVVFTASSGDGAGDAVSYAGASQTSQPDAFFVTSTASNAFAFATTSLTTVTDNSWVIIGDRNEVGGNVASTGSTLRANDTSGYGMFDSGGPVTPAGLKTMTYGTTANSYFATVMVSFKPFVVAATSTRRLRGTGITR